MNAHSPMNSIRQMTLADVPKWIALAKERYPGRDVGGMIGWVEWCITSPDRLVLVGSASVGIAAVGLNYGIERRGRLEVLYTIPRLNPGLEALAMVELMVRWAKGRGAEGKFDVDPDTNVDFGPFVRRLGGGPASNVRYEIPY